MKRLVIAGNQQQAMAWAKKDCERRLANNDFSVSLSDYILAPTIESIRGIRNPRGVFIGTWRERKDIKDIVQQLFVATDHTEPSYHTLKEILKTL